MISLFSQSLFALDLERAIEGTAALGFDAIELACHRSHFDLETARRDPERVARRVEQAGLAVSALSGFNTFTVPHRLTDEICPHCGNRLVEVTTTGHRFCSNSDAVCDYEYREE